MSLTRKMLKAMGIEDEKIEQIIEAHLETVNPIKEERDNARKEADEKAAAAKRLETVQRELDEIKSSPDEFKAKYEKAKKDFDDFKAEIAKEKETAQKRKLYGDLLKSNGVDDKRIEAILKVTDLDSLKVENGAIADKDAVSESIKTEWAGFIVNTGTEGAKVDTPPKTGDNDNSIDENIRAVRRAMGLPDKE